MVATEYSGVRLGPKRAKVVANAIRAIERKHGSVRPEQVVEAAAVPESPLHNFFVWDDSKAAHQYRLVQAAWLIRTVRVRVIGAAQSAPLTTRAFVRVSMPGTNGAGAYVNVKTALSAPEWRAELLAQALSDLRAFRRKYAVLSELRAVFDAAEQVIVGQAAR
jgi:hypothetical protein